MGKMRPDGIFFLIPLFFYVEKQVLFHIFFYCLVEMLITN
jgi:hypothetical protein